MIELYKEKDMTILGEENSAGSLLIHCSASDVEWNKSTYERWVIAWMETVAKLKEAGLSEVFAIIPKDKKLEKFGEIFGMSPLIEIQDSTIYRRIL